MRPGRADIHQWVFAALSVLAMATAIWLAARDVYTEVAPVWPGATGNGPVSCSSAINVVAHGGARVGGQPPTNLDQLSDQCLRTARLTLALSGGLVLIAGLAAVAGVRAAASAPAARSREAGSREAGSRDARSQDATSG